MAKTIAETLSAAADLIDVPDLWMQAFGHRCEYRESGCIYFIGAKLPSGYGKVGYQKRFWLAHRLSLHLYLQDDLGTPTADDLVMHDCDDPRCINPHHLRAASAAENTADMISKGRAGWQTKPEAFKGGCPPVCKGEKNGRAMFTNADAVEVRRRHLEGASYGLLSKTWGVGKSTIADLCKGRTYQPQAASEGL